MTTRAVIAHLSDLHYGNHCERVEGALRHDLLSDPKPDFIVVTGDLSQFQQAAQFEQAKAFLKGIISALSTENHPARVIVIPGNHDVSVFKRRSVWDRAFLDWEPGGIDGVCKPGKLVAYHSRRTEGDHATAERLAREDWKYCEYYPECQLAFLKFDSNRLKASLWDRLTLSWIWQYYARGRVGREQIKEMERVLARYEEAFPPGTNDPAFKDARKIALVHHHIHYLPNVGSDSIFLMLDAGRFWRTMIERGVELVLHGHKHYATHAVIRYMKQVKDGREERELMVLSAGTATSNDRPDGNSYYQLEADVLSCRVRQRSHKDVAFQADGPAIVFRRNVDVRVPGAKDPVDGAALDAMLTPDEVDYVRDHDIEEMNYEGTIDRDLGYTMEITYAGTRRSNESLLTVPMVVVNAPARLLTLRPVVTDLLAQPNATLKGVEVEQHPSNVRKLVIKITLPAAKKGSPFKIRLKVSTPSMMYEVNDFDAVGLLRYRYGPKTFTYALKSEREFSGEHCFAVHRSGLRPIDLPPTTHDADGYYVVRPEIGSLATLGAGLLCHYHKLLPIAAAPASTAP